MTDFTELVAADHDRARRSPDHVIDALSDMFASTETSDGASPYVRLYLSPISNTIEGRWIAIDLHPDDAARIIAELGKALSDVLLRRAVGDGTVHELCLDGLDGDEEDQS
jgi:hypothetical protein